MKRIPYSAFIAFMSLFVCCSDVNNRLTELESRVQKLEQRCQEININITSLQTILDAIQNRDYIIRIDSIENNSKTIGYTISFEKGKTITLYHGHDGTNGEDGKDGQTPQIGVKQYTDGVWYWTLNGSWLLDYNGEKVKAVGNDGKNGDDGVTPQLKIEEGCWLVSLDNGQTWELLGKATGENGSDGDSVFKDVIVTDRFVTFVLVCGETFVVRRSLDLSISFDTDDLVVMRSNSMRDIHYTITSVSDEITIEVLGSGDVKALVVRTDDRSGYIRVKTGDIIDEYSKVLILVTNGDKTIIKALSFEKASIEVIDSITKRIDVNGGLLTLDFFSNVAYQVEIPDDAKTWVSMVPKTKAMTKQSILLNIEKNNGIPRSSIIKVRSSDEDDDLYLSFVISQDGYISREKYFQNENDIVHKYMTEVEYSDYSDSKIKGYAVESGYRMDWPREFTISTLPVGIGLDVVISYKIWKCWTDELLCEGKGTVSHIESVLNNLQPNGVYVYELTKHDLASIIKDTLKFDGQLRMIKTENGFNIRDVGGWRTKDGKRVRYGRIFRGGAFSRGYSEKDAAVMIDQLGINVEVDLRSEAELKMDDDNPSNDRNYSVFGNRVSYYHCPMPLSGYYKEDEKYVEVFRTVLSSLEHGENIYIHCAGGADRTGTIMLMLEALLGVEDQNMAKDYELTSFAPNYYDKDNYRYLNSCSRTFDRFKAVSGKTGTTYEIATQYLLSLGVTQDEIDRFRNIMLESYY